MQFKLQKRVINYVHADRIKSQNVNAFRYIERFQYHEHYSTIISNDYKHIFRNVSLVSSQNLTYIFYGTSLLHVLCFDRDYIDPNNITGKWHIWSIRSTSGQMHPFLNMYCITICMLVTGNKKLNNRSSIFMIFWRYYRIIPFVIRSKLDSRKHIWKQHEFICTPRLSFYRFAIFCTTTVLKFKMGS